MWKKIHRMLEITPRAIDDNAKNGVPREVRLLCSFYCESLCTWINTIVNKFAISNHTTLTLGVYALRSYLKLICKYELHSLLNIKVSGAKDHGKNYIKVKPTLVRHLLRISCISLCDKTASGWPPILRSKCQDISRTFQDTLYISRIAAIVSNAWHAMAIARGCS